MADRLSFVVQGQSEVKEKHAFEFAEIWDGITARGV
jgi:hypothetical protein